MQNSAEKNTEQGSTQGRDTVAELTYRSEQSAKFWRAGLDKNQLSVTFGRLGTSGQSSRKTLPSEAQAFKAYNILVCEKLAKGYKPTPATMQALFAELPPMNEPKALASLYIGEDIPEDMPTDLCTWMTCCLMHDMPVRQFRRVWQHLMVDQDDDELMDALGTTEEECWADFIGAGEGEVDDLYARAVAEHGTHFIWYNTNGHMDIVALRGDPGEDVIARAVFGADAVQQECGLEAGAPIAWIWEGAFDIDVGLRDGTVVRHT